MSDKIPLSVVVLTRNEEARLSDCLDSVKWADEIIVVDDESTDRTTDIARRYSDKIFTRKMDNEGRHRNWAYSRARNTWILSLDADEAVTAELKREIEAVLSNDRGCSAFSIPLRNYIGGYWVRYAGWYPASKVRLFKKDKFKYEEALVHPRVFIDGVCGHLKSDIIHISYAGFEEFLNSINRQTTLEAQKWINTNRKMSLAHIVWRTVDRFFRRYLRKKGYRDGLYGFMVAFFDSLYQVLSYAKFKEMKKKLNLRGPR